MNFKIFYTAALLIIYSGTAISAVKIYPIGGKSRNLRVPTYLKADKGAKGDAVPFKFATFRYKLAPHLAFKKSGEVEFMSRSERIHSPVYVITLKDNKDALSLRTNSLNQGLKCLLIYTNSGNYRGSVSATNIIGCNWTPTTIKWDNGLARLIINGKATGNLNIPVGFNPQIMECNAWSVDELKVTGSNGTFSIDWENRTYAGKFDIKLQGAVTGALLGFDTNAVTMDKSKRECPVIHITNTTSSRKNGTVYFSMTSEVAGKAFRWNMDIDIPPQTDKTVFIEFPEKLKTDVYHLKVSSPEFALNDEKHFMYVKPRGEKRGPDKFGWHACVNYIFGGYPDPIPVRVPIRYSHWSYVYAPFWQEDYKKHPKTMPILKPEEWNYEKVSDWLKLEGKKFAICIQTAPGMAWGQAAPLKKRHGYVNKYGGSGVPRTDLFQQWFKVMVERYKDNVIAWEVENEPNAWFMPEQPEEYWKSCKAVYEVVKSITPKTPVYGISGTANFLPWMNKALAAGAGKYLDGPSWHTYVTIGIPDYGVSSMLKQVVKKFNGAPAINTETGCSVVMRYKVDRAIPAEEVRQKREARVFGFAFPSGFPSENNDEWEAANIIVRNVVVNFCAGAKLFTFFGRTLGHDPEDIQDWTKKKVDFRLYSVTPDGKITPSLYTLAIGVVATQLEGATFDNLIDLSPLYGINGGIFPKAGGGHVAVLWAKDNSGSIIINSDKPELEQVSIFGKSGKIKADSKNGKTYSYVLELDRIPRYIHSSGSIKVKGLPVSGCSVSPRDSKSGTIEFKLVNKESAIKHVKLTAGSSDNISIKPKSLSAELPSGTYRKLIFNYQAPGEIASKTTIPFHIELNGGIKAKLTAVVKPMKAVGLFRTSDNMKKLSDQIPSLKINREKQVAIGRAPLLASLQEDKYWRGPDELSGNVRLAENKKYFIIGLEVKDSNIRLPERWPGIHGTSVEIFFDFRTPENGLGQPSYGRHVYQFLAKPVLTKETSPVEIWSPQLANNAASGIKANGRKTADGYEMTVYVPWSFVNSGRTELQTFGFDIGINGAFAGKAKRKIQMMLFGTAANCNDPSAFARIIRSSKK